MTVEELRDVGTYAYSGNGISEYKVTDKLTGVVYNVTVRKCMSIAVFDMSNPNIVYVRGYSLQDSTYGMTAKEAEECGIFTLVADDTEKFISQLEIIITLNPEATCSVNKEGISAREQIASSDVTNTGNTFTVTITAGKDGFGDNLWIPFTVNGNDYGFCFELIENDDVTLTCGFNNVNKNTIPNAPFSIINLYDYMSFGERRAEFEASINAGDEGRYSLAIDGAEPLFENGVFKGKAVFYHPFERIAIYDKEKEKETSGVTTNFQARLRTAVKAGTTLDLRTLIGGYWKMSATTLSDSDKWLGPNAKDLSNFGGKSDSADTAKSLYLTTVSHGSDTVTKLATPYLFEAPEVTETTTYTLKVLTLTRSRYNSAENPNNDVAALFYVTVYPEGKFTEAVGDIIDNIPAEGDEILVDVGDEENAELDKEIIDKLKEVKDKSKSNSKLIIKNKKSAHGVEWNFSSNALTGKATKNLDLEVRVGEELVDDKLDNLLEQNKITGIKAGFADNGTLPGPTEVKIFFTAEEIKQFGDTDYIQVYYVNSNGTGMSKESEKCYLAKDPTREGYYYITITLTHNSNFVLTSATKSSYSISGNKPSGDSGQGTGGGTSEGGTTEKTEEPADKTDESSEKSDEKTTDKGEKSDEKTSDKGEAQIAEGTVKTTKNGDKVLVDEDGQKIKKSVVEVGNDLYYADKNGKVVTNKIVKDTDGNKYFAGKNGKLAKNKVVTTAKGEKYFAGKDGKLVTNKVITDNKGNKYFATKSGKLAKNKLVTAKNGKKYYAGKNGKLVRSKWVKVGDVEYYCNKSGRITKTRKAK